MNELLLRDPLRLAKVLWPHVCFYREQRLIIESVWSNDETFVPAGNMLGKDFVAGCIVLLFFLTRQPCRVVTTSANYTQLESVLWGEIRRFLQESVIPLTSDKGGPLLVNHMHIRRVFTSGPNKGETCPLSYVRGIVSQKGEGMLGHHIAKRGDGIPRTLMLCDEASGVDDVTYERACTWADRILAIGNCYQGAPGCTFFERLSEAGDVKASVG